jgi:hypothetical protein
MSMFKNKHLVTAAIVAPVLALIGYFGVNALVGESPHAAEEGQSYQLVEMPSCRYSSGHCGLKNSDFELNLSTESLDGSRMLLMLESEFPLDGVKVALVEDEADVKQPVDMRAMGADGLRWSLEIARPDPERNRLHLVASANGSLYFGDAAMKFTLQETR